MKATLALILMLTCALFAQAQEIRIGALVHDVAPLWGNEQVERGVDGNLEIIFGESIVRSSAGVTVNSQGHTSRAYGGAVVGFAIFNCFIDFSLGLCTQMNAVRRLGSTVLFRIAGEIGYRWSRHSISLMLDHISNAGLAEQNAGLDVMGLRYGYRF